MKRAASTPHRKFRGKAPRKGTWSHSLIDLTGQTLGGYEVIRRAKDRVTESARLTTWVVRCLGCGTVATRGSRQLRWRENPHGCKACMHEATRAPAADRVCRWCDRSTGRGRSTENIHECGACLRTAARNGRDAEGRPIAKKPRRVGTLGKAGAR